MKKKKHKNKAITYTTCTPFGFVFVCYKNKITNTWCLYKLILIFIHRWSLIDTISWVMTHPITDRVHLHTPRLRPQFPVCASRRSTSNISSISFMRYWVVSMGVDPWVVPGLGPLWWGLLGASGGYGLKKVGLKIEGAGAGPSFGS